jgi:acyl-[acyl-carrier-protein]-phospholipid O-acyltransferase/long-chain-fatty-acid--[acyl-carrier-protein] ligase
VALQLGIVAVAVYLTARWIPPTAVGAPGLRINYNPWTATRDVLRELRADDRLWVGSVAVSWFWMVGALTLSLVPVIVKARIGGGIEVETAVNLIFAVGVAGGSLAAAQIAHGRIRLARSPIWLLIMAALGVAMGVTLHGLPDAQTEIGLGVFFSSPLGLGLALAILVFSAAAGMFVVPITAAVQAWSPVARRARVIGGNNTLNSIYMVVGSLVASLVLKATGVDEASLLAVVGALNLPAAAYFWRRLPRD